MKKTCVFLIFLVIFIVSCLSIFGCINEKSDNQNVISDLETWILSQDAKDYNGDKKIDKADYEYYKQYITWKLSSNAKDYDDNLIINENDFEYYNLYLLWRTTSAAKDYNDDKTINENDYECYKQYIIWKEGLSAKDYDGNSIINDDDYKFYNAYNLWLVSAKSRDYNLDNDINEIDYSIYLLRNSFKGKYHLISLSIVKDLTSEDDLYLPQSEFKVIDLLSRASEFYVTFDEVNNLVLVIGEKLEKDIGEESVLLMKNYFENSTVIMVSNILTEIVFNDVYNEDFTFYLSKTEDGLSCEQEYKIFDETYEISFTMSLINE